MRENLPIVARYSALPQGWSRHKLECLTRDKQYERVAPGTFVRTGVVDATTAVWIGIAAKRPKATLCLVSAAAIHDLTDEIPQTTDLAIPRGTHTIAIDWPTVTWHRFAQDTFTVGRTDYHLADGSSIGLYSAERTIIDLFRMRHHWGPDFAVQVLKRWLRHKGNSPSSILNIAEAFPAVKPWLRQTLEVLL